MLNWLRNEHSARCDTRLVRMFAEIDWAATRAAGLDRPRYQAIVEGVGVLSSEGNLETIDAAQAWCTQEYARLLREELAAVE
jgi:hypothetical protein